MAAPSWFEKGTYFGNKLAQVQADEPDAGWTANSLAAVFAEAGYANTDDGLYQHFVDFGNAENISPSAWFVEGEYKSNKLAQMQRDEPDAGWTMEKMEQLFKESGLSYWDHYTKYGMYEGISPSSNFDNALYMEAKLAQMQRDEPDAGWTMEKMEQLFKEAGLNPIEHYALYGKDEHLDYTPVKPDPTPDYVLTPEIDTIPGTAGDDIIAGVVSSLSADRTLNPEDSIDGAEGNDTLNVSMQGNFTGFTTGSMVNVENVVLTNEDSLAHSFSAKGIDGVNTWTLNDKGAAVNLTDLSSAGVTVNVQGLAQGSTSIGFTADAVKGDNDALTLGLNKVGTAEDGNTAAKYVSVTANGIENLAVNVTDDSYVDLRQAGSKTVTVSGAGDLDVNHVAGTLTSFDASASNGDVTADLSGATLSTVKGGSGDDAITVTNLAANAVIEGGAGNDSLILKDFSGTLQPTMSGFENVTAVGGTLTISGKNVSDFNSLTVEKSAAVKLSNVDAPAFTVNASGDTAGSVTLSDATALTYNTVSSKTDKTANTISTSVTASKATSATVNVGEYTKVSGSLDFAAASDVTVNVASGLGSDGKTEMTSFSATVNANKAQNLTVNADGELGISSFNVNAATSVLVDAAKGSTGAVNIQAGKATDVSITAGADMDISGSVLGAAQNVTLVQNKGALDGTGVNLASVNRLTLSGADNTSAVSLGQLGSPTQEYGITVDASGLKAGLTLGNTDAGEGDVTLNLAEVTGTATVGTVDGNNVTVHAAQLGTTALGDITAVGNVSIDAMGVLGGSATVSAVTVGDIAVSSSVGNQTTISVQFDGNSDMTFGALTADTVSLDASNYLGSIVTTNVGGTVDAAIGAIKADTVDIKGSEIGANTFGSAANTGNFITANTLTYTGGLSVDEVFLTGKSGTDMDVRLYTGADDDNVTISSASTTTKITVTGDMGGDNNDEITVKGALASAAININLSGLTGYSTSEITGTSYDDTITLGSGVDTVIFGADVAANGNDTIKGFEAGVGKDILDVSAFVTTLGSTLTDADVSANLSVTTKGVGVWYGSTDGVLDASDIIDTGTTAGKVTVANGDTVIVLVTTADDHVAGDYNMYYVTGATGGATVELVGTVTTDSAFDIANFA